MLPKKRIEIIKVVGNYNNGRYVRSLQPVGFIFGSVQPTGKNDLERLPEGSKQLETYTVYTNANLDIITEDNDTIDNPIMVIDSVQYKVIRKEAWQNNIINHYKYIITKVK